MRDINDGKYVGPMTPKEFISHNGYRIGLHLAYLDKLETEPVSRRDYWLQWGNEDWHNWAINGYEVGIEFAEEVIKLRRLKSMDKKKWYTSKTVVFNALAAISIVVQAATGEAWLDASVQGAIIVIANLILRLITGKGLEK